jgi:curved DNA-binding protein CbpA
MAKKWYPDKNTDRNTTVQMQLLSEAYSVLKDLEKRKKCN